MTQAKHLKWIMLLAALAGLLTLAGCEDDGLTLPRRITATPQTSLDTPANTAIAAAPDTSATPGASAPAAGKPTAPPDAALWGPIVGQRTPTAGPPTAAPSTPTQPPAASATPAAVAAGPTAQPTAQPGTRPSATPDASAPFGPIVDESYTVAPTEARSTATQAQVTPAPGGPFGPIVGPNHTLVPTETRVAPTVVPTIPPTPGPSPTPGPGLDSNLMGIQIHPHIDSQEFDRVIGLIRELGVDWVKLQFNWSLLESSPGRYTELYFIMTEYVKRIHDQGFQVMISVAKAPGWARTAAEDGVIHEDGPPDDPVQLATFITALLNHLGRDDSGRPYVDAIEVWNEPNLQREWYGHPLTGAEYMRYFGPAYSAIRAFSPEIAVITAGPAPTGDSQWSANDRDWLRELYAAGLAQYGANVAVGIHPYGWANAPDARCCTASSRGWDDQPQFYFLDTIETYRQIMTANGHSAAQMWGTEFGWATFDGLATVDGTRPADPVDAPYFSFIDQAAQANYTVRAFQLAQDWPYMGPMILWNLNFSAIGGAVDRSNPQAGYGLVDSHWQPRPVFHYLQQAPKY